ncbi:unnamed protein product [Rotaria sp. Silwood2]|nr:unnamed protein product [Rotaria sp. Silwood2]
MTSAFTVRKGITRILEGIMKYRHELRPLLLEEFKKVALGPSPEGLLLTCVDTRVVASRLTQAVPGQLFFVRNPGNLVPPYEYYNNNSVVGGECAALELACSRNNVPVIAVFGHSDCKAMNLLYRIRNEISTPSNSPLEQWLKVHARGTVEQFKKLESSGDYKRKLIFASAQHHEDDFEAYIDPKDEFKHSDKLSQVNTLEQLKHFLSYPFLRERLNRKELQVHALWTDIYNGELLRWRRRMRRIRSSLIFIVLIILVVIITTTSARKYLSKRQQPILTDQRIDCFPEAESRFSGYSKESCLARNCLFDDGAGPGVMQCYLSPNYGYTLQGSAEQINNGLRLKLKRNPTVASMFQQPIENVLLEVQHYTDDIIRFKLYDADNKRYEVPIPLSSASDQVSSPQYKFSYSSDSSRDNILSFSIKRRIDNAVLFDTSLGGLVLNNQFLQIVTRLQSSHVYGFGENNHDTLKHNVQEKKSWGIFARDQGTNWDTNSNHYGSHPFYLVMEQLMNSNGSPSGRMHGVLLLNSNAMDYAFEKTPSLTIRTIGGILDFFVFLGPTPEQVVQQYTWLVGRSILPPYWSFGFQLSRWGYSNLTHMQNIVKRNRDAGIPLDVQYADIDYMEAAKDFTIDPINFKGLKEYFAQLNSEGVRTIIILDPGTIDDQTNYTPTIEGMREDVFIKSEDGQTVLKGSCWPGDVFFPDFFTQRAQNWWSRLIKDFHRANLSFDGLWIDMNEPALFDTNEQIPWNWMDTGSNYTLKCSSNQWDDPPYRTKAAYRWDQKIERPGRLSDRTLCMTAVQGEIDSETNKPKYRHYDVHNLYGWSQTKPTLDVMREITGKRSLVLPRSTFVGSGQWSGHWLGDNEATWHEIKRSLIGMVEFNWFGIPFNGADICGFDKTPSEEMCIRWMQVGAFYPYSRNHNIWKTPDQDPAAWSSSAVSIMVATLRIRYTLLPYYYTLFYKAHTKGSTVIRPLFHEYPTDKATLDLYLQFLIGPHIMIAPVTDDGARQVQVYIPSSHWYSYYSGVRILSQKQFITLSAPLNTIPILLRGGAIIPTQEFANNTKYSRGKPFGLTIVLNSNGNAEGDLFYDDGESIDSIGSKSYYYATYKWSSIDNRLIISVVENNYPQMSNLILNTLTIYGLDNTPTTFNVNDKQFQAKVRPNTQVVDVIGLGLPMSQSHTLTWTTTGTSIIEPPPAVLTEPKYRVDCYPDPDAKSIACEARGCNWNVASESGYPSCYVPKEKGGYGQNDSPIQLTDAVTHYSLSRLSTKRLHNQVNPNNRINLNESISNVKQLVITRSNEFSIYGEDIDHLNVQVSASGTDMLRLTIRDADKQRYEVPVPIRWQATLPPSSVKAKIKFEMTKTTNGQVGFRLKRTNTQSIIFDTSYFAEGFIYDDKYIQFITTIPTRNVYGFGENTHPTFRHILKDSPRYGIFARDQPPQGKNENLYGTQPFYIGIEEDGQTFGVLIFNSNAQDYKLDEFEDNQSMLTYRTLGGILDIIFFAGPRPEDVIRQYQTVIGTPYMPPYWSLGFQLCRYGYDTLENMRAAMQRTLDGNIPLDVMYGDIDYFRKQLDFTWDPIRFNGLPEYVNWLHTQGMRFITILDPAIDSEEPNYDVFTEGQRDDIWVKWPQNKNVQFNETKNRNMVGYVWPIGKTVFPDYFYPPAKDWWKNQVLNYYNKLKFDGLWIDMNEPANFDTNKLQPWNWPHSTPWNLHCPLDDPLESPRYKTAIYGEYLSDKTLCMVGEQSDGRGKIYKQYDVHNLYGWSETVATLPAARATENKRSLVISRSTFPTSGSYAGHWLGDNTAAWSHLKYNIIGMLEFNLFGIPYVGADICGFEGNTTEEMCQRWMQLGAFNPFFRNHNGLRYADQDPGNFPPAIVQSNRRVVETRYTLIPYLYTLFHRAHISGGTIVRSMAHEFSTEPSCWSLDEQFLWGSYLLIAPVIYQGHTTKDVYLPINERWFNYYTGIEIKTLGTITDQAPRDYLPLYLRGGSIIPHQQSAMNTVLSRRKPFYLYIALDKNQRAQGDLFWDDGESINTYETSHYNYFIFNYDAQRLTIEPWTFKYPDMDNKLEEISIFGMTKQPTRIILNGQDLSRDKWTFDTNTNVLKMLTLAINLSKTHKFIFV